MQSASCWQQDYDRLEQELRKGEYVRFLWRLQVLWQARAVEELLKVLGGAGHEEEDERHE